MDSFDWFFAGLFLFFCVVCGSGYLQEQEIKNELLNTAGEDYIKMRGQHVTGSNYINEVYDKNGGCVGIYYIENKVFSYQFRELKNFGKCEAL